MERKLFGVKIHKRYNVYVYTRTQRTCEIIRVADPHCKYIKSATWICQLSAKRFCKDNNVSCLIR